MNTDLEDDDLSKYTEQYERILSMALSKLDNYESEGKPDERMVLFSIDAKTAKDVTHLRWRTDTHEAIIGYGAEYKVLAIFLRKGYYEIHLEEY